MARCAFVQSASACPCLSLPRPSPPPCALCTRRRDEQTNGAECVLRLSRGATRVPLSGQCTALSTRHCYTATRPAAPFASVRRCVHCQWSAAAVAAGRCAATVCAWRRDPQRPPWLPPHPRAAATCRIAVACARSHDACDSQMRARARDNASGVGVFNVCSMYRSMILPRQAERCLSFAQHVANVAAAQRERPWRYQHLRFEEFN